MLWFSVVCCSTTSTTQSLQNKEVWVSLNVVKKPKSYWGKGNTVYEVSKVTFTSLMFHPLTFQEKRPRCMGTHLFARSFCLLVALFFVQSKASCWEVRALPVSLSMDVQVSAPPVLVLSLPYRALLGGATRSTHAHIPNSASMFFFLRNCPSPAPKPFQRAAPTLFNFNWALTNSE